MTLRVKSIFRDVVVTMAWMRIIATESVGYLERTALEGGDDPGGKCARVLRVPSETLMEWGSAGATSLGLHGEVGIEEWRAVFGSGGVCHPESGKRLVHCLRPGMELGVSPHGSGGTGSGEAARGRRRVPTGEGGGEVLDGRHRVTW